MANIPMTNPELENTKNHLPQQGTQDPDITPYYFKAMCISCKDVNQKELCVPKTNVFQGMKEISQDRHWGTTTASGILKEHMLVQTDGLRTNWEGKIATEDAEKITIIGDMLITQSGDVVLTNFLKKMAGERHKRGDSVYEIAQRLQYKIHRWESRYKKHRDYDAKLCISDVSDGVPRIYVVGGWNSIPTWYVNGDGLVVFSGSGGLIAENCFVEVAQKEAPMESVQQMESIMERCLIAATLRDECTGGYISRGTLSLAGDTHINEARPHVMSLISKHYQESDFTRSVLLLTHGLCFIPRQAKRRQMGTIPFMRKTGAIAFAKVLAAPAQGSPSETNTGSLQKRY